jgi:hypothetical protein
MVFVALAALNFTAIRAVSDYADPRSTLLGVGALPMANILVVSLFIGYRSRRGRRFLFGFEAFGAMALAAYIAVAIMFHSAVIIRYLHLGTEPYRRTFVPSLQSKAFHLVVFHAIGVVMFALPQLAFALIGGLLSRRFGTAERRDQARC